jgi:anti-sigma factor RsiW
MARLFGQRATKEERRDELLSAYLDGQLSAEERAGLEAQLATDPDLRAGLEAMRHTVALVRDLPPVPVPRNFILPQTAAARPQPARPALLRRAWAAPFLTAATAVFGLLFAVILAGDLLLSGAGGIGSAPMPEAMMLKQAEVPQQAPVKEIVVTQAVEREVVVETVVEEVEVVVEVEAEAVAAEKAVSPPPPAPELAEAPLAAEVTVSPEPEGFVAEADETEEAADAAVGGGGPTEEPAAPAPTSTSSAVATDETEAVAAVPAAETAVPGTNGTAPEPPPLPGETLAATPWAMGEGEAAEEAAEVPPEGLYQGADYGFARVYLRRALEAVLGLVTLGLIGVTIWAWRVRRR